MNTRTKDDAKDVRLRWLSLLIVLVLSAPSAAFADAEEEAQKHFDRGAKLYIAKDFTGAIVEFRQGYALNPDAFFLYNISGAHLQLGEFETAYEVATTLPAEELPKKVRVMNSARIEALRIAIKVERESFVPEAEVVDELVAENDEPVQAPEPEGLSTLAWVGIGTAATGGAALVGWTFLELAGQDKFQAYEDAGSRGDVGEYDRLRTELEDDRAVAQIVLITGATLTIAGAGLLAWELLSDGDETAGAALVPTPGGAALVGRF